MSNLDHRAPGWRRSQPNWFQRNPVDADLVTRVSLIVVAIAPCLLCPASIHAADPQQPLEISWSQAQTNQLSVAIDERETTLKTTGSDPFVVFPVGSLEHFDRDILLAFEYSCPDGVRDAELRIGPPFRPEHFELPSFAPAEGWTQWKVNLSELVADKTELLSRRQWRIDLGNASGVTMKIRNAELRAINDRELEQKFARQKLRQEKQRAAQENEAYFAATMSGRIERVAIDDRRVTIAGQVDFGGEQGGELTANRNRLTIVGRSPHERTSAAIARTASVWPVRFTGSTGRFETLIDVADQPRGMRYQLAIRDRSGELQAISHARGADSFPASVRRDLPPPAELRAAKGLTCLTSRWTSDELRELGLQHGTVNIVLSGLVRLQPAPGFDPTEIRGRVVYVHRDRIAALDHGVRVLTRAEAVVAGILLIPTRASGKSPLMHPEADVAGTYAMPDLTTAAAVELYVATLDVLADRYCRMDGRFGRIDHWIVHNEVDYGWQWTNMGQQPMELFMDHYARSLRLVDASMRSVNPHARVFISLTHRWNVPDDQPWRTYAPRAMLRWLIRASKVEGDFPWGIAYHPYPQSLWNADTWNDTHLTQDDDTPLITMANLEVLDRFARSDAARMASGQVRPVILSEQGFHAAEDDEAALEIQSAALLYAWQQLRKCPSILAFDYHRVSDHRDEGGLRLGLRGLPNRENPRGRPKPAWDIFRAIGTPAEAEQRSRYESFWRVEERASAGAL